MTVYGHVSVCSQMFSRVMGRCSSLIIFLQCLLRPHLIPWRTGVEDTFPDRSSFSSFKALFLTGTDSVKPSTQDMPYKEVNEIQKFIIKRDKYKKII